MSINLMSAIFRTEFRDIQDQEGNKTKASTAKFVCIALADHANDEGEGAYPSIGKLSLKTSLSRTAVINALDALKFNGVLIANGPSKYDTINYTVNPSCFSQGSQPGVLVISVDPPSQPEILPPVNPVDPNHTLTIPKPSLDIVDGILEAGKTGMVVQDALLAFEAAFKIENGNIPWFKNRPEWTRLRKKLVEKYLIDKDYFKKYLIWYNDTGKFAGGMNVQQLRRDPDGFLLALNIFDASQLTDSTNLDRPDITIQVS